MKTPRLHQIGLTAIEAAIAVAIIAIVIIAATFYFQRSFEAKRRAEHAALQTIAKSEPWKVFTYLATPSEDAYERKYDFPLILEITNPTPYQLDLDWRIIGYNFPGWNWSRALRRYVAMPKWTTFVATPTNY
jgi:Flp pilus assembly pilin Flp